MLRAFLLAALLAPAALLALDENALLGRMDNSSTLTDLKQQLAALSEAQMGMTPLPDAEFKKRKRDIEKNIRDEQRRIKDVRDGCKAIFAKGKKTALTAADKQGRTVLMLVASLGIDDLTRMVLADNPSLSLLDNQGRTALYYESEGGGTALRQHLEAKWAAAVNAGDVDAASSLMDAGMQASDNVGDEPALAVAIRKKHGAMVTLLTSNDAYTVSRTAEGYSLLELACRVGDAESVGKLLSVGADDGAKFSNGVSPLFYLAVTGSAECFGAYVNTTEMVDKDVLPSYITRVGSPDKIRLVVKSGEAANKEDKEGNIPVHEAARRGDVEVFRTLLDLGGSRTAANSRGETTLMHAALSGDEEVMALALEGVGAAEIARKDKKGKTASDYAKDSRNKQVWDLIQAAKKNNK